MLTNEDELPLIPIVTYEYLKDTYSLDYLLSKKRDSLEEHLGYLRGVNDVLNHIKNLTIRGDEDVL